MQSLKIVIRHFGIGLLAHAAAAVTAAGAMSANVLLTDGIGETNTLSLSNILAQWAFMSISIAMFISLFTVAVPFLFYPLALIISRRSGRGTVLFVGGLVGFALGVELGLSGPGPTGYPMLTPDEYRTKTREFVLFVVSASTIAGMVFGWVVASFDVRSSQPAKGTGDFQNRVD